MHKNKTSLRKAPQHNHIAHVNFKKKKYLNVF